MRNRHVGLISLFLTFFFISVLPVLATDINSCQQIISSGSYNLNESISININADRCIEINVSDVVFDGDGYTISGYANDSVVVYVDENISNIIIRNFKFNTATGYAIWLDKNISDATIINNTIDNLASPETYQWYAGIVIGNDTRINVLNNWINGTWDGIIFRDFMNDSRIENNQVTTIGGGIYSYGIDTSLVSLVSRNISIINNTIDMTKYTDIDTANVGILANLANFTVNGNTIIGTGVPTIGLQIFSSETEDFLEWNINDYTDDYIKNNNITGFTVWQMAYCGNGTGIVYIENNTVTGGLRGIGTTCTPRNNKPLYLINNTIKDTTQRAMRLESNESTIKIIGNTITNAIGFGAIVMDVGTFSNVGISNNNITSTTNGTRLLNVNATITGNYISGATNNGIYLENSTGTINENIINNSNYGIYLYQANNINMTDNYVSYGNTGIYLSNSNNNIIRRATAYKQSNIGISLSSSNNNTIQDSTTYNATTYGIVLTSSNNCVIRNTTSYNNLNGAGIMLSFSANNIVQNVTVNENGANGILLNFANSNTIQNAVAYRNSIKLIGAGITLVSSNNNIIEDSVAYNNGVLSHIWGYGIFLVYTQTGNTIRNTRTHDNTNTGIVVGVGGGGGITIDNITSYNQLNGIGVLNTTNSVIRNSVFYNNLQGIGIGSNTTNMTMYNNNITNNTYGIVFTDPLAALGNVVNGNIDADVYSNNISRNYYGVYFNATGGKVYSIAIYSDVITDNDYGIYLYKMNTSLIYNNLLKNTVNALANQSYNNQWNVAKQSGTRIFSSGNLIGGNYWSNPTNTGFSDTCVSIYKNGICDSAYTIDANNVDNYPLGLQFGTTYNQAFPIGALLAGILLPIVLVLGAKKYILDEKLEISLQGIVKVFFMFIVLIVFTIGLVYVFQSL